LLMLNLANGHRRGPRSQAYRC